MEEVAPRRREPIFNVPGIVLACLAVWVAIHASQYVLETAAFDTLVLALALIPARYIGYAADIPGGEFAAGTSLITHMAVHVDQVHLIMNAVWFLAFGSILARRLGSVRFLSFLIAGTVAGGLSFLALHWGELVPMIGASGGVAALMGGVMRFLTSAIDRHQTQALREAPDLIPRLSLKQCLRDYRVVGTTLIFLAINLLAMVGFGAFGAEGGVAWEAHVGGYAFGLLAFALFDVAPRNSSPNTIDVE